MATDEDAEDIELAMASLRADASDLGAFVEALALKLEQAVPAGVRVHRGRARPFGPKRVDRITLDAGGQRLELRVDDRVRTYCSRLSGGIVIKNDELSTDDWLRALGAALAVQARESETTRQALERLLDR